MRSLATIVFLVAAAAATPGQASRNAPAGEVVFTSGARSTDIPFAIANNLILIKVSVNGSEPSWFIFDTGAESTVIDPAFARTLSLKQSGTTVGTGSAGTATAGVIKGASLRLGDLEAKALTLYSLSLAGFTPTFGMHISGIVGNDVTRHVVADIDYQAGILRLYDPDAFTPPPNTEMLPLTIEGNLPFIRANVLPLGRRTPISAKIELDTGSTGALLFNGPFVRRHRLIQSLPSSFNSKTGGVGGSGQATIGRIGRLELGRSIVDSPIATLYRGTRGDNASSRYDGLLGGGIFRRYRVIIDIPGRRAYFTPTPALGDPFEADMSGLELVADGDDLKTILIDEVFRGSAAARAGIKGGEVLETIDGRKASDIGLQEIRRMLRQDGKEYDLGLRRGKDLIHVKLRLTRVI